MTEHDDEPVHGLPEELPPGEHILWQGAPRWQALARRALHMPVLAVYFGVLMAWRAATLLADGAPVLAALVATLWLLAAALAALAILGSIAWLAARTAVYTVTNRRVVLRVGVVLTVTFNLPFKAIDAADVRVHADGSGDIPLALADDVRISYLHLWPHAQPWHVARPRPMLRGVPDVAVVAGILARAVNAADGTAVRAGDLAAARVPRPLAPQRTPAGEGSPLIPAQ